MSNNLAAVLSVLGVFLIFAVYILCLFIAIKNEKNPSATSSSASEKSEKGFKVPVRERLKHIDLESLRGSVCKFVNAAGYVAMATCFIMVFVVSIDVILRKLTGQSVSIHGSNEFSSYFLIVICMLSIPMLHVKKGHIWVNMIVDKFPTKFRNIWMGCMLALESILTAFFTFGCVKHALNFMESGRTTDILNLPMWPFALICAFGFAEFCVLLVIDTIQLFVYAKTGEGIDPPEYRPEDVSE